MEASSDNYEAKGRESGEGGPRGFDRRRVDVEERSVYRHTIPFLSRWNTRWESYVINRKTNQLKKRAGAFYRATIGYVSIIAKAGFLGSLDGNPRSFGHESANSRTSYKTENKCPTNTLSEFLSHTILHPVRRLTKESR